MSDTNAWGKILIVVILIMGFWWWRSDKQRIKRIDELTETVQMQEEKIEELEGIIKYLRDE